LGFLPFTLALEKGWSERTKEQGQQVKTYRITYYIWTFWLEAETLGEAIRQAKGILGDGKNFSIKRETK